MTDIDWRLTIDGVDWTCDALVQWTVEYGRRDADRIPDPGRGRWTLMVNEGNRAQSVRPGSRLRFEASVDGSEWLPVATMIVADVTRTFEQPDSWNTISIDAEGPTVVLARINLPEGWRFNTVPGSGASPFEEPDGSRVAALLSEWARWPDGSPLLPDMGRTALGHTLADDWPAHASRWSSGGRYVLGSAWTEMVRTAGGWPPAANWHEVEFRFTLDAPAVVWQQGGVSRWFPAGSHRLVAVFYGSTLPRFWARALDPKLQVMWKDADRVTQGQHQWPDVIPAGATWATVDPGVSAAVLQLTGVDGWVLNSWPYGGDVLTERPGDVEETVLAHLQEVSGAVRSVLWESRDGRVSYQQRQQRATAPVQLTVDACDVETPTVSTAGYSSVRNKVEQFYGYGSSSGRDSVTVQDTASQTAYGVLDRSNNGPIRDQASATAIANQILAGHKDARELLESLPLKRLEYLPAGEAASLLELPLGSRVQVVNGPPGWVASTWDGFVEGVELTGGEQGTRMVLQVSDRLRAVGFAATPAYRVLSAGRDAPVSPAVSLLAVSAPPGE